MVQMYTIAGRQIGSHYLAIAVLGTIGGLTMMATGGSAAKKTQGPPINASGPDEEKFIKEFLAQAESGGKPATADAAKK
ncbi:Uncharacterized protein BP5553_04173 [Venustampulla echinocandica]|uniref:ATP synthase subunit K, mitochondrial n=1 Tax=Venustampulla echinocandica TaxID=2656787 RepID=A0A370TWC7_9HELO|nr:Uncharacterized protein BP5553_04173 [Venustampulla echinocandica]RDL39833.1 Uncharacterized protein BP5553_04173 [Venustampulla echinocandica]